MGKVGCGSGETAFSCGEQWSGIAQANRQTRAASLTPTHIYPHFEGVTKPNTRDTRQRKLHAEDRQSGAGSPQLLFGAYPQNSKIGQQLAQDKNQYVRKFLSVKQKSNLIIFFKSLLPISNQLWKTTE